MEKQNKPSLGSPKRKRKLSKTESEPKNILFRSLTSPEDKELTKKKKLKKQTNITTSEKIGKVKKDKITKEIENKKLSIIEDAEKEIKKKMDSEKYPILKDTNLIEKFLKVPMTNNQKGRIRQAIKMQLQGSTDKLFPDIINGKIQSILKSSPTLTDSDLRRIRILYNMLKTSIAADGVPKTEGDGVIKKKKIKDTDKVVKDKAEKDKVVKDKVVKDKVVKDKVVKDKVVKDKEGKENVVQKVKGPKRYVVFLGNLPLNVTKDRIMEHFSELNEHIKDIRIPKVAEGNKSAIAYVELSNEPSYELALSKHHSMMGTKRINVLYTTQKKSKITKTEAKSKSAKLIALQKSGKLIGSIPMNKKRSHRRAIQRKAQAKEAKDTML